MSVEDNVVINAKLNADGITAGAKKVEAASKGMATQINAVGGGMFGINKLASEFQNSAAKFTVATSIMSRSASVLTNIFAKGIEAAEAYNMRIIQSASVIASLADTDNGTNIADTYKNATIYAGKLQETFVKINDETLANVKQMNMVNLELNKQGVIVDTNNQASVKSFATLTNAIAIMTAGMQNQNMQFGQEIRALLEGNVRQGSTLALFLKRQLGPNMKDIINDWKRSGTFLENIAKYLKGFDEASKDIKLTWESVTSTLQSNVEFILQKGFRNFFQTLVKKFAELNSYILENADVLASYMENSLIVITEYIDNIDIEDVFYKIISAVETMQMFVVGALTIINSWVGKLTIALWAMYAVLTLIGKHPIIMGATILVGMFSVIQNSFKEMTDAARDYNKEIVTMMKTDKEKAKHMALLRIFEIQRKINETQKYYDGAVRIKDKNQMQDYAYKLDGYRRELSYLNDLTMKIDRMKISELPKIKAAPLDEDKKGKKKFIDGTGFWDVQEVNPFADATYGADKASRNTMAEGFKSSLESMVEDYKSFAEQIKDLSIGMFEALEKGMSSVMVDWMRSGDDWATFTTKAWNSLLDSLAQLVADFMAKQIVMLFVKMFLDTITGGATAPVTSAVVGSQKMANMAPHAFSDFKPTDFTQYDVGTNFVPEDQFAYIHKGEMIIPAKEAEDVRNGSNNSGIMAKLDQLITVSAQNKYALIDESGLSSVTRAVNRQNFKNGRFALA